MWSVPPAWDCIDIISDLHLSEASPRTFEAWAAYLRSTRANAVLILGDLFEVWVGDDARESGFEARCAAVLADAATRCTVAHMVGNRDFLVGDAMLEACNVRRLQDPTVLRAFGRGVLLSHGDALCTSDLEYQRFRARVRDAAWQRDFLAQPLDRRRAMARGMREASEARKAGSDAWVDVDVDEAVAALRRAGVDTLIHGHTHRPADTTLGDDCRRIVLSDWDLDEDGPGRAEVLRWQRHGFERLSPDATA